MRLHLIPLLSAGLLLSGCFEQQAATAPPPQEISSDATAEFCGMALTEHAGPKGQVFLRDNQQPLWFASVHDTFAYLALLGSGQQVAAVYVNDMGKVKNWSNPEPGTWVDAHRAFFVIDSSRRSGMDEGEAVPFSDPAAAEAFQARYGGRKVRFAEIPQSYILPDGASPAQLAPSTDGRDGTGDDGSQGR